MSLSSTQNSTNSISGKPGGSGSAASTPVPSLQPSSSAIGNDPSRRSGGGGGSGSLNSGAGGTTNRGGTPRNSQSSRRGHRNHRKPSTPAVDHGGLDEEVRDFPLFSSPPTTPRRRAMPRTRADRQLQVMMTSNSRKGTSIAINWDLSTPHPRSYEIRPRGPGRRAPTWGLGSGYHAVDKAR